MKLILAEVLHKITHDDCEEAAAGVIPKTLAENIIAEIQTDDGGSTLYFWLAERAKARKPTASGCLYCKTPHRVCVETRMACCERCAHTVFGE